MYRTFHYPGTLLTHTSSSRVRASLGPELGRSRSEWVLSMPLGGASHGEGGQSLVHGELDALLRHVLSDLSGVQHEGHVKHLAL